jgi:hypothetical protein
MKALQILAVGAIYFNPILSTWYAVEIAVLKCDGFLTIHFVPVIFNIQYVGNGNSTMCSLPNCVLPQNCGGGGDYL